MTAENVKVIRKVPKWFLAMWTGNWGQAVFVCTLPLYFMFSFAAEVVFFQTTACGEAVPFMVFPPDV